MLRTHKLSDVNEKLVGKKVTLVGWVDTIREHGKLIFLDLRDRYGKVQCVITPNQSDFSKAKRISLESCIQINGKVKERPKGTENKELSSGKVEVGIEKLEILNPCPALPYDLKDETVSEDIRLKYRFLDLRSKKMQSNLLLRNKILKSVRDFFYDEGFVEIETPILAKSTPEGARDYIVPSRNFPGSFYALPQSPQLFKQLSMMGGFDRYIQMARCFRDEDLRSDRQPEFTQVDVEMSFIEQDDIIDIIERLLKKMFKDALNVDIKIPFPRIKYDEAMKKYGTDKPDLRKNKNDPNELAFCWVLEFPMFEYNKEDKRYYAMHHHFTMPNISDFKKKKENARALAYDVVLNGVEIGGGSIRIHNLDIQKQVFDFLGISEMEAKKKFGFLLEALSYGAPPHGGIALGFDRIVQIMAKAESIREVIAFPKNKEARDVMLDAPSEVAEKQLKEIHIKLDLAEKVKIPSIKSQEAKKKKTKAKAKAKKLTIKPKKKAKKKVKKIKKLRKKL